jgi:MFS family permease
MKQEISLKLSKNRSLTLIFLSLTLILSMSTWFSATSVLPQLREQWDLSQGSSAWLTIAVQIGFVVGSLISTLINLSDILSPSKMILVGSLGSAVVNLLLLWVDDISLGIALRFATGFFLVGVYPPAFKLMSTWFRKGRGTALGVLAAALVLGNGIPHLVNGLGGLDWHIVIYTTSALSLLGGLIAAVLVKMGPYPFPKAEFNRGQIGSILANRGVRLAILGYIGHMWELFAMFAWFSTFYNVVLQNRGIPDEGKSALATFAIFVAGSLGCWLGGLISDRWGRANTTILMLAISGCCSLFIGILLEAPPLIVLVIGLVWGFSVVADSAQFSTLVTELADQTYVGTALTLQLALGFAVTVVTIWVIPILQEIVGWQWAFAFLAPGPVVGILSMFRLKKIRKELKMAPENR